ncbi:hypothetical protein SH528x_002337 [Novipirellula sp. SH528]|uniref:hypothetical protein n=1 Tax=Novipirellula sp. SH528 TaxID=3454466 RepID=UPI003FA06242
MNCKAACPVCLKAHSLDEGQAASVIRCDCGATLFISPKGRLVATLQQDSPPEDSAAAAGVSTMPALDQIAALDLEPKSSPSSPTKSKPAKGKPSEDTAAKKKATDHDRSHRKTPWLAITGIGGVALLLVVAVTAFLLRDSTHLDSANEGKKSARTPQSDVGRTIRFKPGTFSQQLAKIPLPTADEAVDASIDQTSEEPTSRDATNPKVTALDQRSPFGGPTVKRTSTRPVATKSRPRIPIVTVANRRDKLDDAYADAFESYEAFTALSGDDKKNTEAQKEDYRRTLGETIDLTQHAYALAMHKGDLQKRNELCYLLAYLSFTAGHVIEASLYGESVARYGDPEESMTREAALIALAAIDEAAVTQWAAPEIPGELNQMKLLAELFETRWPNDPQVDAIWMNLGQRFDTFDRWLDAADAYLRINKKSETYDRAQMSAGSAYWNQFVDEASEADANPNAMVKRLKSARDLMVSGIRAAEQRKLPLTSQILDAKYRVALIEARLGNPESTVTWLEKTKTPLVDSITTGKGNKKKLAVTEEFAQNVFQLLYQAKTSLNDFSGAKQALERLSKVLDSDATDRLDRMSLAVVQRQINGMLEGPKLSLADINKLEQALAAIDSDSDVLTASNQLWLAESWAKLARHGQTPKITRQCYENAAKTYASSLSQKDFPSASRTAGLARQAELLRMAGKIPDSLEIITTILTENPGAIEMQIQAAKALEQIAFQQPSEASLRAAILGPASKDRVANESPIWGWAKLTGTLHQIRYSDRGTAKHAELLLAAHLHLARCRWLLAGLTSDAKESIELARKTKTQLSRLQSDLSGKNDDSIAPWSEAIKRLQELLDPSTPL